MVWSYKGGLIRGYAHKELSDKGWSHEGCAHNSQEVVS